MPPHTLASKAMVSPVRSASAFSFVAVWLT
jgi:hypothetical protein